MKASEIRDRDSLEAWLDERPQEDAVVIGQRAACRVAPIAWARSAEIVRDRDYETLAVCRALLTTGVAVRSASSTIQDAVNNAFAMVYASEDKESSDAADDDAPAHARYAATQAVSGADAADYGIDAIECAVKAATATANTAASRAMWDQICLDAVRLENGNLHGAPLWHGIYPDWFAEAERGTRAIWPQDPPERWAFWTRWWDGVLSGRHVDWELQRQVALIPDDIWRQGPDAVAEAIAKLEESGEPDAALDAEIARMEPPKKPVVQAVKAAMEQNRDALPPTFDAIEGLLALEIGREQHRNYTDDLDLAQAMRRIGILLALHSAISQLRLTVPELGPVPHDDAATAEKLLRYYANKFAELPRAKAGEVVEGVWETGKGVVSVGLILGSGALAGYFGLPALGGLVAGSMVFAPKNSADIIKAAKEFLTSPK